eukprot:TRINITY_DN7531_c0_g1_i3.p1 TRINITY_DN7531_c0_g1~~TRINITY_DN7531_c0_g1_i3.p1  ORF type:complete len:140 (+),score=44.49 TRINITY_DN7531_c0_g1_i3:110-529(+)
MCIRDSSHADHGHGHEHDSHDEHAHEHHHARTDHTGHASAFAELNKQKPRSPVREKQLKDAFELIDANQDGMITRPEMIKALRSHEGVRQVLGLSYFRQNTDGHTAFEHKFQQMDQDNNREICWEEFATLLDTQCNDCE